MEKIRLGAVFSKTQHRRRFTVRLVYFCTKLLAFLQRSHIVFEADHFLMFRLHLNNTIIRETR